MEDAGAAGKDLARIRDRSLILAINGGSSSLKFALFDRGDPPNKMASGKIERIGGPDATWTVHPEGAEPQSRKVDAPDQGAGATLVKDWVGEAVGLGAIAAVGHRVVHGGPRFADPERISDELIGELRRIAPMDPDHMAGEIVLIEAFRAAFPDIPQVACFDTSFHHDLPRVAQIVPIPRRFDALGVRRYGFHGLSYEYLVEELRRIGGDEADGRVILAHLGSGASLAAVKGGRSIDTSMAFTPAAGLVMATRTGDIDPGLVRFLMGREGLTPEGFDRLVNKESGLLGVSQTSGDVRDLLAREASDERAAEAVALFCYQVKKWIGAFAAALGGLDTLVFSGGIGENSPEIRRRICEGLEFLGVALDDRRNAASEPVISAEGGRVKARRIPTDEESVIAGAAARLLA